MKKQYIDILNTLKLKLEDCLINGKHFCIHIKTEPYVISNSFSPDIIEVDIEEMYIWIEHANFQFRIELNNEDVTIEDLTDENSIYLQTDQYEIYFDFLI